MSQRSEVATSGSIPIAACSAACGAPGMSTSRHPGARPARRRAWSTRPPWSSASAAGRSSGWVPSTSPLGSRRRKRRHLGVHPHRAEATPRPGPIGACARRPTMSNALTDWACVVQPGSPRTTWPCPVSRSSSVTTQVSPWCTCTAPVCTCECADASSIGAQHPAGARLDDRRRPRPPRAARRGRRAGPCAPRTSRAGRRRRIPRATRASSSSRACGAEHRQVGLGQRQLGGRRRQVRAPARGGCPGP